jgi:hypothetical protein
LEALPVGAGLRARLRDVAVRIGMLDAAAVLSPGNRFRAAALLPANAPVPVAMQQLFPEGLAELGGLGKAAGRCNAHDIGSYRVYALPYFFFDGFNALLAVEERAVKQQGEIVAAWKDSEANQSFIPKEIHVNGGAAALERFLKTALSTAR